MNTKRLGDWGEELALEFLSKKGYSLVRKGFRSRFGEIDLIVKGCGIIAFVEVKLRKNSNFAYAREFVGKSKQKKIRTTAMVWLGNNRSGLQPRFDVIEIYAPDGAGTVSPEITHIEDAFQ